MRKEEEGQNGILLVHLFEKWGQKKLGDSIPMGESTLALALVIPGLPSYCIKDKIKPYEHKPKNPHFFTLNHLT